MLFPAFPIVYREARGCSNSIGGLAFISLAVGMMGAFIYSIFENRHYNSILEQSASGHAEPEARLPPSIIGAIAIPIGLFWFAWTNSASIHWLASIAAGVPLESWVVLVIFSIMNYLIGSYTVYAAHHSPRTRFCGPSLELYFLCSLLRYTGVWAYTGLLQ
jgi:hypothetical protein